jgi:hypothetical protein
MADIDTALAASRDAVDQLIRAGEQSGGAWIASRAPGRWSPSQIVEHVARTLEESANMAAGRPSKFPRPPFFVRPIARIIFKRVLRKAAFPKAKAFKAFNPASGPATPAEGRIRLETAHQKFDEACRRIVADGRPMPHPGFGSVPVQDYVRFMEIHTRHHGKQIVARQ